MRKCTECKLFNSKLEFGCTFYNVKVSDETMANDCGNFISNRRRHRCNRCVYLCLSNKPDIRNQYICKKLHFKLRYTSMTRCSYFKKKIE